MGGCLLLGAAREIAARSNKVMKRQRNSAKQKRQSPTIPRVQDGMYNAAVFWPEALSFLVNCQINYGKQTAISPTAHAKDRIQQYGLPANCYENALAGTVVEATVVDGKVRKIVTRYPDPSNSVDWCAVICFERKRMVVITMWRNNRQDQHRSLRTERYVQ